MAPRAAIRLDNLDGSVDLEAAETDSLIYRKNVGREKKDSSVSELSSKVRGSVDTANAVYVRKLFLYWVACVLVGSHLIAHGYYLSYRFFLYWKYTKQVLHAPWLLVILSVECAYFCSALVAAVDHILPPGKRAHLQLDGHYFPTVDIFLPCCKEPTEVPKDSIVAALALDYSKDRFKIFVLDDGGDDDLRAFCGAKVEESEGRLVYLRREKNPGKPHNFKCGNLNFGLEHSNSEYVVMMDADMILHPSYLRKMLPHIVYSPNIAFVQIPQAFYNLPPGDPLNDLTSMFYDKVLGHRDTLGCATCVGTGALFSRKHLNHIGGFQPQSITEDTTTAYALFREGFRSVYINEKLQIGLSSWTFEGYVKQRTRWGCGAIQQFRATCRSMLGKDSKLNFALKVLYIWHSAYYLLSIVNFLLLGTMFLGLLFRLDFHVGTQEEAQTLFANLSFALLIWRISWLAVWLEVPQSVQSRNRDESTFWWMSPYFTTMIIESIFSYSSTFSFVPTSNIDRNASKGSKSPFMKRLSPLKHVKFHIAYNVAVMSVVIWRFYLVVTRYGFKECGESLYVLGIGWFMFTTCAHMMLPVTYILWPTGYKQSERMSLIHYSKKGVPTFTTEDCYPKWHWSVIPYEVISYGTLILWAVVYIATKYDLTSAYCKPGTF
ncbi:hypothetical protein R1flu_026608 [Riccia fluitans]|uniref:Glycosyltransferase 2-like domain-containing protein n=1 Tax=Riccia fluitans TaxID=41844 RepID=A0ABD1XGY2_9MARC